MPLLTVMKTEIALASHPAFSRRSEPDRVLNELHNMSMWISGGKWAPFGRASPDFNDTSESNA